MGRAKDLSLPMTNEEVKEYIRTKKETRRLIVDRAKQMQFEHESSFGTNTKYEPVGGSVGRYHVIPDNYRHYRPNVTDEAGKKLKDWSNEKINEYVLANPSFEEEVAGEFTLDKLKEIEKLNLNLKPEHKVGLIDMMYNIGSRSHSSTLQRLLSRGNEIPQALESEDYEKVEKNVKQFSKGGGGIVKRRQQTVDIMTGKDLYMNEMLKAILNKGSIITEEDMK